MNTDGDFVPSGGAASPGGFHAGATHAGIKYPDPNRLDVGILYSEKPCAAAAVFTTNKVKAAPVLLDRLRLKKSYVSAVVMNSGCANACTGANGMQDAIEMAALTAQQMNVNPESVLVASTGVIGVPLPMDKILAAIPKINVTREGGHDLARAIMTTDRVPKEAAVSGGGFTIGGMMKGSGMIHPNLATLLCFLTTDAPVDPAFLRSALRYAVSISFNMLTVDGDGSTNDTVLLLANGAAGGHRIAAGSAAGRAFQKALNKLCVHLAREAARDGEGATKLIEITVRGAATYKGARLAARTIAGSSLVKTAVYGADPNWGRILAAAGRSGASLEEAKAELFLGDICLYQFGAPVAFDRQLAVNYLKGREIYITLNLHLGKAEATAWGCDLTEEYVKINAEYTT